MRSPEGKEIQSKASLNRVLLIQPENGYYTGFQGLVRTEPLGIEFVAGAITPLVKDVRIQDERVKPGGWREKVSKNPPDMIGISCNYTADVPATKNLIKQIRHEVGKEIPIVVGGHHISLRPKDMFIPEVDAIVFGPGEKTFQNVVKAWGQKHSLEDVPGIWYKDKEDKFVSNVPIQMITPKYQYKSPEMNERPQPRRDLVTEFRDGYYFLYYPEPYSVETARGCRFRCTFCSVWNFHGGEYNVESSNRTVNEIANLGPKAKYVNLVDDLAFSDINAASETADELLKLGLNKRYWAQIRADNVWPKDKAKRLENQKIFAKLAEAGLDMTLIGLESFDPKELKRVNKGSTVEQNIEAVKFLRSLGVKIWAAQIVFPNWGVEDFDKTIAINQDLGIECPQFTILTPLPGTPDYDNAERNGQLTTNDPGKFDFFHWTVPTKLPPEEIYRQISRMYREVSPFATKPDGRLVSMENAKRQYKSIKEDIREGRTTPQAVKEFTERFKTLQDGDKHIAHLAVEALAIGGSKETTIFDSDSSQELTKV